MGARQHEYGQVETTAYTVRPKESRQSLRLAAPRFVDFVGLPSQYFEDVRSVVRPWSS